MVGPFEFCSRDHLWCDVCDSVRCLFFEIKRIPIEKTKRCWVCPVMIQYYKSWIYTYDFLVIDTAKARKKHTIPNGFCRKKYRYIILPDSLENRLALQKVGIMVERKE